MHMLSGSVGIVADALVGRGLDKPVQPRQVGKRLISLEQPPRPCRRIFGCAHDGADLGCDAAHLSRSLCCRRQRASGQGLKWALKRFSRPRERLFGKTMLDLCDRFHAAD